MNNFDIEKCTKQKHIRTSIDRRCFGSNRRHMRLPAHMSGEFCKTKGEYNGI